MQFICFTTICDIVFISQVEIAVSTGSDTGELALHGLGAIQLPPSISSCARWLVKLDVSGNELLELPGELRLCVELEELVAADNCLLEYPVALCSLPRLLRLDLRDNLLVELPEELLGLSALEELLLGNDYKLHKRGSAGLARDGALAFKTPPKEVWQQGVPAGMLRQSVVIIL